MMGSNLSFLSLSILLSSSMAAPPERLMRSTACWSPAPNLSVASTISSTRSRLSSAAWISCIILRLRRLSGLCTPGVSMKTIWPAGRPRSALTFRMPWMRVRVVCGFSVTMAIFSPTSALSNVLLPAFGRPMMETNPERNAMLACGLVEGRSRPGASHAYFLHFAVRGFQDFKAQAVVFNDFAGLGNAACERAHQPAHGSGGFGIKVQIKQVFQTAHVHVAFDHV